VSSTSSHSGTPGTYSGVTQFPGRLYTPASTLFA
jgi:hypothetical protein